MSDLEKLYNLIVDAENEFHKNNHYAEDSKRIESVVDYLIAHGVTVKIKKPLTVEEVRALQEFAWLEWRNDNRVQPMVPSGIERDTAKNVEYFTFWDNGYAVMSNYGKTWRCWAEKPTDEERQNAKWEE